LIFHRDFAIFRHDEKPSGCNGKSLIPASFPSTLPYGWEEPIPPFELEENRNQGKKYWNTSPILAPAASVNL
jgi:hypothetical protein